MVAHIDTESLKEFMDDTERDYRHLAVEWLDITEKLNGEIVGGRLEALLEPRQADSVAV